MSACVCVCLCVAIVCCMPESICLFVGTYASVIAPYDPHANLSAYISAHSDFLKKRCTNVLAVEERMAKHSQCHNGSNCCIQQDSRTCDNHENV